MLGRDRSHRFQALTLPFLDRLLSAARSRLGSPELAEDLVQEAYLKAWEAFDGLKNELTVYAWLYRIMRRTLADHYRQHLRRSRLIPITDLERGFADLIEAEDADPFVHAVASLAHERMTNLLAMLPEEFAEAVVLHDVEGFAYREIAEITGTAIGTVMSRISRGRRLLAGLIHHYRHTSDDALRKATDRLAGVRDAKVSP